MTQQHPPGWYPQPDGTQRYWDGEQWTQQLPAAPPQVGGTASPRQWWQKKRVVIPAVALVGLVGFGALNGGRGAEGQAALPSNTPSVVRTTAAPSPTQTPSEAPEPSEPPAPTTFTMPDVVGSNLQDAQDELQALGSYLMDQEDASGKGRLQLDDSNWTVCTQTPAPGTETPIESTVILASVKNDEVCPGAERDEPDEPAGVKMTRSQEQAVRKAGEYLDFAAFSRSGLIGQLEFEGFSKKDAGFAVDHLDVNWNEQAAKKAEDYLDLMSFSRKGLIEQLEFEGFTRKQAEYGVKAVGL